MDGKGENEASTTVRELFVGVAVRDPSSSVGEYIMVCFRFLRMLGGVLRRLMGVVIVGGDWKNDEEGDRNPLSKGEGDVAI